MAAYGITYQGSKNSIAEKIIEKLPAGNRFVDLFGGGFAISHCALLSGKYKQVLYNEFNPLLVDLIKRAIEGDFNPDKFTPDWVSREKFKELKEKDGYIKYIWSFGSNGKDYMYSREMEPYKKAYHFACLGDFSYFHEFYNLPTDLKTGLEIRQYIRQNHETIKKNYIEWYKKKFIISNSKNLESLERLGNLERLQNLERLGNLERLQRLGNMERLEITNDTYLNYKHRSGDVIYCDPPYENTRGYDTKFDHAQFYNWANSREYPVYFSSYPITDDRFTMIAQIPKRQLYSSTNNSKVMQETIYANKAATEKGEE